LCGMDPVNHKYDLRHLQSLSSTGDETNETNEEPMNMFQPLNSDHSQALNNQNADKTEA
ncbi:Hypothetical predicted protein, partial [Paramuricea clavata]